ncbi:MAG: phosphoribosylglycinamide formyltransferase [Muribaculaceae bacterium]|nr:phosphoribosylglycinamide formyltransferase [Muribaculaceae bacterium]
MKPSSIAIFASGSGSNAENIIRYCQSSHDCRITVALVICNRPNAGVVARAEALNILVKVMTRDEINNPSIIIPTLEEYGVDAIVLAGFLLMIPGFLIDRFAGRIINIHPSLLPKYGGKGMYGRHIHEAVVAAGEKETGITIHHVSGECDGGEIIFQTSVELSSTDSAEDVERKIHQLEYLHYPQVIADTL